MKNEHDLDRIIESLNLPFKLSPLQYIDVIQGYMDERFALFYDVGGGKTLVATLIAMMHGNRTVVTMPHILLRQWERWLKRANVPEDSIYIHYGPKRSIDKLKTAKWVLTSHAIFRMDYKKFEEAYKPDGKKVTLLVDEAQAIKNIKSKLFDKTSKFIGDGRAFIPMSATPTAKPEDTYAYMKLKTPGVYRSKAHWEAMHVEEIDQFGSYKKYNNLELLRDNFAMKSAKRDKKELFNYQLDAILDPIPYDLSPAHMAFYKKIMEEKLMELPNGDKIDATTAQRLRHTLQQIIWNSDRLSGDPELVPSGFDLLETVCEQVDFMNKPLTPEEIALGVKPKKRTKFVIWTYYKSTTERIFQWMTERFGNTGVAAYSGANSQKAVDAIMFDDNIRWAVFNPMSVGAGLELQFVCWEMFFAEMVTTPIPNRQAIGRVERPGQEVRPTVRIAQAQGTVQPSLFRDLLKNDERVVFIERTRTSLRDDLMAYSK